MSSTEVMQLYVSEAGLPTTVVAGTVRNALDGQVVPGATVMLNGGATAVTTAQGQFTFSNVPVSTVAISAAATGFNSYFNGFALAVAPTNVISFAMSPAIANTSTMRLVLNWGASPSDLDSHLETPVIGATNYHVYFADRGSLSFDPFASLDVDDVTGFGPETITITNFFTGTYHYYVHNFSGFFGGGQTLAGCGATAQLYTSTGLAAAVQVPAIGIGDYWYVARIDGASRVVTIVNQITNQVPVVLGAPTFTNLPQSVVTNLGATAVFNVGATGTGPLSYQWRLNGVSISGANGTMLVVSNIQLGNRGQYTCLVSSPLGTIITPPATLSLNTVAAIVQPQSLSVPPGTNVTFMASVIGLGVFQYQWRFYGINIPGATNTSLTLTDVQAANGGSYSFVVLSSPGTVLTTADASLEVLKSPSITTQPVGATNLAGDTVNFIVEAAGSAPLTYQWQLNGVDVPGALASTLILDAVSVTAAGTYTVIVSNAAGAAVSSNAVLAISSAPVVVVPPSARIVNATVPVGFSVMALGDAPFTYQWRLNGTNIAGATSVSYSIGAATLSHEGLYSVVVGNALGSATSSAARLTVLPVSVVVPWAASGGGIGSDVGNAIAVDAAGNSHVAGYFTGTATFGTNTLVSAGNTDIFIAKHDSNGQLLWVRRAGGPGYDAARGIAVDTLGNCHVTGAYEGEASFNGSTSLTNTSPATYADVFIAKYDAAGNLVWARSTGAEFADDEGTAVAVDGAGDVLVTGRSVLDAFAGAPVANTGRIFVAKYTGAGAEVWARKAGSYSGGNQDTGTGIATDSAGNVFVGGVFYSPVAAFGAGMFTGLGSADMFLAKFDPAGTLQWARQAGGTGEDTASGVAVAADGSAYLVGAVAGNANFSGSNVTSLAGASSDGFIAKYAGNGSVTWVRQMGGSGVSAARAVAVDAAGTVHVTGYFSGGATFGTNSLGGISGSYDAFLTRLDAGGVFAFAQQAGGADLSGDFGLGVGADAAGNSFITGYFSGASSVGGAPLPIRGAEDVLVARFNQFTGGGPPQLGLLRNGPQFRMRWPLASSSYILQSTTNLLAPLWLDETNALTLTGSELETDVTPGNTVRFFRLRRP